MKVSAVVAINRANVIGVDGKIPWHNRDDLRNFRELTLGHILIMGRKTYESFAEPLNNRTNIVLSRKLEIGLHPNVYCFHKYELIKEAIEILRINKLTNEVFVIGGAETFTIFSPLIDRIYLTVIDDSQDYSNAVYFPWESFKSSWQIVHQEKWHGAWYYILDKK